MRALPSDCPLGAVATQTGAAGEGPGSQQTVKEVKALHERLQDGAGWECPALDHVASSGVASPCLSPLQAHASGTFFH